MKSLFYLTVSLLTLAKGKGNYADINKYLDLLNGAGAFNNTKLGLDPGWMWAAPNDGSVYTMKM